MRASNLLVFALCPLLFVQQSSTPENQHSCSIKGVVISAATKGPLAGVTVTIGSIDSPRNGDLLVTTDANGHYTTGDIEPGRYSVSAILQGYVPQTYGQRRIGGQGVTLTVRPGMNLEAIDFRLIRTGVITGKVMKEDGEPVTGATIQAVTPLYVQGERRLTPGAGPTITNDLGEYRIYGLAPDRYFVGVSGEDPERTVVTIRKEASPEERYLPTLYPGVNDIDRATPINVPPGEEIRGIDVVVMRSRTFQIDGKVMGSRPSYECNRVQLQGVGTWEVVDRGAEIPPDNQGNFRFRGVTPGAYLVSTSCMDKGRFLSGSRMVQVQKSNVEDLSLFLSEGWLRAHLTVDGERKTDFKRVHVNLIGPHGGSFDGIVDPHDPGGSLVFDPGLPPYSYRIQISGADDLYVESGHLGEQEITNSVVDLSKTERPYGTLEIALSTNGGRIDGIVTDENGESVLNAAVVLVPDSSHRSDAGLFKSTPTNQSGQFSMRGIKPGSYQLFAWDDVEPGIWWDHEFLRRFEDKGEEVTIDPNARVRRSLHVIHAAAGVP